MNPPHDPTGVAAPAGFALDLSNYTGELSDDQITDLFDAGVGLCVVRASIERESLKAIARQQMGALQARGMPLSAYAWDYWDWSPSYVIDATYELVAPYLDGFAIYGDYGKVLWQDAEDAVHGEDVVSWMAEAGDSCQEHGLAPGVYSGAWWWIPNTGNTQRFNDWPLWDSHYDGNPDPATFVPYGGWERCVVDQYNGTSTIGGVGNVDVDWIFTRRKSPRASWHAMISHCHRSGQPLPQAAG